MARKGLMRLDLDVRDRLIQLSRGGNHDALDLQLKDWRERGISVTYDQIVSAKRIAAGENKVVINQKYGLVPSAAAKEAHFKLMDKVEDEEPEKKLPRVPKYESIFCCRIDADPAQGIYRDLGLDAALPKGFQFAVPEVVPRTFRGVPLVW